jgi:hypothetical protein
MASIGGPCIDSDTSSNRNTGKIGCRSTCKKSDILVSLHVISDCHRTLLLMSPLMLPSMPPPKIEEHSGLTPVLGTTTLTRDARANLKIS